MSEIKPGDVVVLNSGGPAMTVGELVGDGTHKCYWFDESYTHSYSEVFHLDALSPVPLEAEGDES